MKLFFLILFFSPQLFSQTTYRDTLPILNLNEQFLHYKKQQPKKRDSDLEALKKSITSSTLLKGYRYDFNLQQFDNLIYNKEIATFLKSQNRYFLNSKLFHQQNTDVYMKGMINVNGITQIITFKGGFLKKYGGNYNLQMSYHLSSNSPDYITRVVRQEVQEGLALKLKINLNKGK